MALSSGGLHPAVDGQRVAKTDRYVRIVWMVCFQRYVIDFYPI